MNTLPDQQRNWSQLPHDDPERQMLFGAQLDSETTGNFTFTPEGIWVQKLAVRDMLLVTDIYDNAAIARMDREYDGIEHGLTLSAVEEMIRSSRATVDQAIEAYRTVHDALHRPESHEDITAALGRYRASEAPIARTYNTASSSANGLAMAKLHVLSIATTTLANRQNENGNEKTSDELYQEVISALDTPKTSKLDDESLRKIIQPLIDGKCGNDELSVSSNLALSEVSLHLFAARVAVKFHDLDRVTYGTSLYQQFQVSGLAKKAEAALRRAVTPGNPPHTSLLALGELDKLLLEKTTQVLRYVQYDHGRVTPSYPSVREGDRIISPGLDDLKGSARKALVTSLLSSKKFHERTPVRQDLFRKQARYLEGALRVEAAEPEAQLERTVALPVTPSREGGLMVQGLAEEAKLHVLAASENLTCFNLSNKQLRKDGIVGQGSLEDKLRQVRGMNGHVVPGIKTYAGLKVMIETYGAEAGGQLAVILGSDAELRARYGELVTALPFAVRPKEQLPRDVTEDMRWLVAHWDEFCAAARESSHQVSDETLSAVYTLLNPNAPEIEEPELEYAGALGAVALSEVPGSDESSTVVTTEWTPEELAELEQMELDDLAQELAKLEEEEARAKAEAAAHELGRKTLSTLSEMRESAEQLDWVVLPPHESASVEALVRHARGIFAGTNRPAPEIKPGRMQELLDFRELLGGTLYRSEQRMLGDDNNLYFVLRFTHEGRTFALAENPIKGNATYVICEEELPLNSGETVLTAVKSLSRKDVRELGAIRIYHAQNPRISHTDKVFAAIFRLARQHESAVKQ